MFIIVLGRHVSIPVESSSGPSKNTDPYLAMFKMRCGIQNAFGIPQRILNIAKYRSVFLEGPEDDSMGI